MLSALPKAGLLLWQQVYARYIGASAFALGVDLATFLLLLRVGLPPAAASALGYSLGIAAHWWLSSRAVFVGAVAARRDARVRQKALFLGSALVGLALTTAIVGLGHRLGLDPRLAKLAAVAIAFQATYMLRQRLVFAA